MNTQGFFLNTSSGERVIELFESEKELIARLVEIVSESDSDEGEEDDDDNEDPSEFEQLEKKLRKIESLSALSSQQKEPVSLRGRPDVQ